MKGGPPPTGSRPEGAARRPARGSVDRFFALSIDMVCIAGFDGYFKQLNPAWQTALGFTSQELRAQPYLEFVHPDDRPATIAEASKLSVGVDTVHFENRYRCKDGSYKWLAWTAAQSASEGLIYAVARDMTEQRESEDEINRLNRDLGQKVAELETVNRRLEESSRLKSRFLTNVSHELRTPLNAIIGFTQMLYREAVGPLQPKQRRYVDNVLSSSHHLLSLINDLLDISKIEAGKMDLKSGSVLLSELLQDAASVIRGMADQKQIQVEVESPEPGSAVWGDAGRLKQVLFNLLSNAIKFTPDGGTVHVGARKRGTTVQLEVTDTGIGVAPGDQERIFGEFQQVDGSETRQFQGTGLGLALTRKLVEMHGGSIQIQSDLGKGSTFTITLPLAADEQAA
jgi:PAS domain S-box-containing protein